MWTRNLARIVWIALFIPSFSLAASFPQTGGILHCAIFETCEEPPFPVPSQFQSRIIASACYEGLTRLDRDGRVIAAVANDWGTEDDQVWRFQIAVEALAHDGGPITATDVVASWQHTLRRHGTSILAWPLWCIQGATEFLDGTATGLDGVRIMTDLWLEIRLVCPLPDFPAALAQPAAWVARGPDWVGTGPFETEAWSSRRVSLRGFTSYRWAPPYLDGIEFQHYSDAERGRAAFDFQAGTIQMLWDAEKGEILPIWVTLQLSAVRFPRPEWKEAVRYAVNVDQLQRFRGISGQGKMRFIGEPMAVHPAWQPYRPLKGLRLLKQTGWVAQPACQLGFSSLPGRSGPAIARYLESQLEKVGVPTQVKQGAPSTALDLALTSIPLSERLLNAIAQLPNADACLLLYQDHWYVRISAQLYGWELDGDTPVWQHLWFDDE